MTLFDVAFLSYISTQDAAWPETLASALKRNHSQHAPRLVQNLRTASTTHHHSGSSSGSYSDEQGYDPLYELHSHPLSPAKVGVAPGQGFTSNSRWGRRLHSKRLPTTMTSTEEAQLTLRDSCLATAMGVVQEGRGQLQHDP